jgi:ribonuclease E
MRPSLKRSIYFDCPHCKGAGLVKTPESMSLDVMRRLAIAANDLKVARIELSVCPDVAFYLLNKKRIQLAKLESNSKKRILVRQDPTLGLDETKLELYDARDGLVFLDELGMRPQEQLTGHPHRTQQQHGRRDDRHRGRHPQGRHDQRRDQRREEREIDEERLETRGGAEVEEPEEISASREAGGLQTPSSAPVESREPDEDRAPESEEQESSVIDVDDAAEPMGEGPRAFDEGDQAAVAAVDVAAAADAVRDKTNRASSNIPPARRRPGTNHPNRLRSPSMCPTNRRKIPKAPAPATKSTPTTSNPKATSPASVAADAADAVTVAAASAPKPPPAEMAGAAGTISPMNHPNRTRPKKSKTAPKNNPANRNPRVAPRPNASRRRPSSAPVQRIVTSSTTNPFTRRLRRARAVIATSMSCPTISIDLLRA